MAYFKYIIVLLTLSLFIDASFSQQMIGPVPEKQNESINFDDLVGYGSVLVVNGDAVSSYDVIEKAREELIQFADKDVMAFCNAALPIITEYTRMEVRELLMYQKALEDVLKKDSSGQMIKEMRERRRKDIVRNYAGNQAIANLKLEEMGTSMEEMLDKFQREVVISSFKDTIISKDNTITRLEIQDYYNNNLDKYVSVKESLEFRLIKVESAEKAQGLLAKLKAGKDFAELAKIESKDWRAKYGGLWDPVEGPDSIKKELKPVANKLIKLQPGQLTDIVESDGYYYIGKLVSYTLPQYKLLAEVQDLVREEIYELRWLEYSAKLSEKLLDRAVIGDSDEFVRSTVITAWKKFGSQTASDTIE